MPPSDMRLAQCLDSTHDTKKNITTTDAAIIAISITRGKPRTAQINRQIAKKAAKMTLSIFAVTDLKDIALSHLIAPKSICAVPSHR